jgi:hypothetical protein
MMPKQLQFEINEMTQKTTIEDIVTACAVLDAAPVEDRYIVFTEKGLVHVKDGLVITVVEDDDEEDFLAGAKPDEVPTACSLENGACEACQ